MKYEAVIGLEVHAELSTKSKIYCSCSTGFGAPINTHTCPVCTGMPGALPVLNKQVVHYAAKMGKATGCTINQLCKADRKNYFYPDLPKAYQISQFDVPICENGEVFFYVDGVKHSCRLERIHFEEDAGKLLHDEIDGTIVDFNRCGVPLIEMVTRPDLHSSAEAKEFLEMIKTTLSYLDICDCKMEEGSILYYEENGPQELVGKSAMEIRNLGVRLSFVPEDRLGMGLVGNMDMAGNMMLRSFKRGKFGLADRKGPEQLAQKVMDELEVVTPSIQTPVRRMSGGNVQKVLVGREIASNPKLLMTAYAVRGLDINTSYTIYHLLNEQKAKGVAVIYVGEDLDVLLELCDRILVLCGGKVSGVLDGRTATKDQVGMMMTKLGGETEA